MFHLATAAKTRLDVRPAANGVSIAWETQSPLIANPADPKTSSFSCWRQRQWRALDGDPYGGTCPPSQTPMSQWTSIESRCMSPYCRKKSTQKIIYLARLRLHDSGCFHETPGGAMVYPRTVTLVLLIVSY